MVDLSALTFMTDPHTQQILQIEMVLAINGQAHHVRFGPTRWQRGDGAVPKTLLVQGMCCNPGEVCGTIGSIWEPCDGLDGTDVTFKDLWIAVRGGGGGKRPLIVSDVW